MSQQRASQADQPEHTLHEGNTYRVEFPDGTVEYLTAKEYTARRGDFNRLFPLAETPSPDAGGRRSKNPGGAPRGR